METQNGDAQALAFKEVKSTLGLSNRQLLEYVWWDAVGSDDGDGASVLVGVAAGGAAEAAAAASVAVIAACFSCFSVATISALLSI